MSVINTTSAFTSPMGAFDHGSTTQVRPPSFRITVPWYTGWIVTSPSARFTVSGGASDGPVGAAGSGAGAGAGAGAAGAGGGSGVPAQAISSIGSMTSLHEELFLGRVYCAP